MMQQRIKELELSLLAKDEEICLLRSMLEESRLENSKMNQTLKEKDQLLASFSNKTMSDVQDTSVQPHEATMFGMSLDESRVGLTVDIFQKGELSAGVTMNSPKLITVESPRLSGEEMAFKPISDIPKETHTKS
jgi:hypothetical protein